MKERESLTRRIGMLSLPTSIAEINQLIANRVQESLHLEYKDSRAILDGEFRDKLTKQISAFANSDGGLLIYGVQEQRNLPVCIDDGVEHKLCSRERIESLILNGVSPRIEGIRIGVLPVSTGTSICAIEIPKSFHGPHQSSDHKYYKRFNFQSVPMEDYEIRDVRNRRRVVPRLVSIEVLIRRRFLVYLTVSNVGDQTAEDVRFDLPDELLPWVQEQKLRLLTNGIKHLHPKQEYSFRYSFTNAVVREDSPVPNRFDISVSYWHPEMEQRTSDTFHFDLMDYCGSALFESDIYEHGKEIKEAIKKLTDELTKLNAYVGRLVPVAKATGLDLSVSTLRNLGHLVRGDEQLEKLDPENVSYEVFMEVLGVDVETADRLEGFFRQGNSESGLEELEGMTEQLLGKIKQHFNLS